MTNQIQAFDLRVAKSPRTNQQMDMDHPGRYWQLTWEGSDLLPHVPGCNGVAFQIAINTHCKNRNIYPWQNHLRQRHPKKGRELNTCE